MSVDKMSEQWRHECEVRFVIKLSTREIRATYLNGVEQKRGKPAADKLRMDVLAQWKSSSR